MITLFTTFFLRDEDRQQELLYCLNKNVENKYIKNIFLLLDGKNEEQIKEYITSNLKDISKIKYISVGRIPTYGDWVKQSKQIGEELEEISIFINADIYIDESIVNVADYVKKEETVVCLTRHEVLPNWDIVLHENPQWSQDLWAISKNNILNINNSFFITELDTTYTGAYRCDNRAAYIFAMRGWVIFNPYPFIKCYHVQKSPARVYKKLDLDIVGGLCFPAPTDSPNKPSALDISIMPVKVGNITKCAINKYLERNLFPETPAQMKPKSATALAFFGASVTKQKTGYVHYFEKLCDYNVLQFGYGGMHLKDAGIIFINEVCKSNPTYCFIEWFTPGIKNYKKESLFLYLDIIVLNLLKINCIPVFLFLRGVTATDLFEDKLKSYKLIIEEYCAPKNIPYIEVYKNVDVGCKTDQEILRDTVHTNDLGSELYAKAILNYFNAYIFNKVNIKNITIPASNKYSDIKCFEFKQNCTTGILIKGNAELVGIYQDIGPFSCFCDVYVDGKLIHKERPLIDVHCHYVRPTINFNYTFKESLIIQISAKDIDYASTVKKEIDWIRYNKENIFEQNKEMRIHSLHYVGEINEVTLL